MNSMRSLGISLLGLAVALAGCGVGEVGEGEEIQEGEGEALVVDSSAVIGSIDFGQTVSEIPFNCSPTYRALRFATTKPNQQIEVWARSSDGNAIAWVTNASFSSLASDDDADSTTSDAHIVHTLRKVAVYYVLITEATPPSRSTGWVASTSAT